MTFLPWTHLKLPTRGRKAGTTDGIGLEIYYEYSIARQLFFQGRRDQDLAFTFDAPLPEWAKAKSR